MDTGTLLTGLRPLVIQKYSEFAQACKKAGYNIQIICGYRSPEEQTRLYNQGRTTPGPIVTNAKAGQSMHQTKIAFDIAITKIIAKRSDWNKIGAIGKSLGFTWGGDFTTILDLDHFELLLGYTEPQIMKGKVDWSKWEVPPFKA